SPRSWYSWTRVAFDYSAITSYPLFSLFLLFFLFFFFFNDTAPTEIYTLSLHDALPISARRCACPVSCFRQGRAACAAAAAGHRRSEEHTSELQSRFDLGCRLLLEKKKQKKKHNKTYTKTNIIP